MDNRMKFEFRHKYVIVRFCGEIDCLNAPYYRHQLSHLFEKYDGNVIFDFSEISFIDSSGIGLILGRYNQLKFDHRKLILTGLNKVTYKLFELSGLIDLMPYFDSIEDALREG